MRKSLEGALRSLPICEKDLQVVRSQSSCVYVTRSVIQVGSVKSGVRSFKVFKGMCNGFVGTCDHLVLTEAWTVGE